MRALVIWLVAEYLATQATLVDIPTLENKVAGVDTVWVVTDVRCLFARKRCAFAVDHSSDDMYVVLMAVEPYLLVGFVFTLGILSSQATRLARIVGDMAIGLFPDVSDIGKQKRIVGHGAMIYNPQVHQNVKPLLAERLSGAT